MRRKIIAIIKIHKSGTLSVFLPKLLNAWSLVEASHSFGGSGIVLMPDASEVFIGLEQGQFQRAR